MLNILFESDKLTDKDKIKNGIEEIIRGLNEDTSEETLYNKLREYVNEEVDDMKLVDTLETIIDDCEYDNEDTEMVETMINSEIDSYFNMTGGM